MSLSGMKERTYYSNSYSGKEYKAVTVNGITLYNKYGSHYRSGLSFSMWNWLLKISVMPYNEEEDKFTPNYLGSNVCIFMNQTKAHMFSKILKGFRRNRDRYNGCGVIAGYSVITINSGSSFGDYDDETVIRIVKFNNERIVDNEDAYQLKLNYNSINNVVVSNNSITFDDDDRLDFRYTELDLIINQLDEFVKACSCANAYTTVQSLDRTINNLKEALLEK